MKGRRNIIKLIQLRNREASLRAPVCYQKSGFPPGTFPGFQGKRENALLIAAPALTFLDF